MMEDFKLEPAKDLGLSHRERILSVHRESDLMETCTHAAYWAFMRTYFKLYHRLSITGLENIPGDPPFVMVANHTSHLDALTVASPLPWRHRDQGRVRLRQYIGQADKLRQVALVTTFFALVRR